MILKVNVGEQTYSIDVPEKMLDEAEEFFSRMDKDMSNGYQMSRTWVDNPDAYMRCQIVADKLLTALESHNESLGMMMSAYLLKRMPGIRAVHLNLEGDMTEHDFDTV
jgi:hypothetical protein